MPWPKFRSLRFRWLAAIVFVAVVICLFSWHPLNVAWKIRTAKSLMNMGSVSQARDAVRLLELAAADNPHPAPELLYLLGRAHRRTGSTGQGLEYLQDAESAGWDSELIRQQRQLALLQRGQIKNSGGELDRLLKQNASDNFAYEVYEALAKGYLSTYRFSDALHCLDFWSEWCSDATDPRMWRATIWEQSEQWEKANNEYIEVLKIDPRHLEARQSLARILLLQLNQAEAARLELLECLQLSPDDFNSQLGLATCELRLAESERAEQRLRTLLNRDLTPQQLTSVQMELGQILVDRRALPEAVSMLSDVVKADPLNSAAHYALGTAYAASSDQENAIKAFDRSRILREQFSRLTTITSQLISHPEKADLRWEAGRILMDQGMITDGAAWMATALIYDPDHKPTHESLAEYYEKVSPNARLAREHREKADRLK